MHCPLQLEGSKPTPDSYPVHTRLCKTKVLQHITVHFRQSMAQRRKQEWMLRVSTILANCFNLVASTGPSVF